jgi:RimJ/RimL family protein N-acetyltransferase
MQQLQTWWDAMQFDDLSVAYNDDFPSSLTDFRLDVAQGSKLLLLLLVDGQVAGASWLHDMVYRPDGTVSAGWLGGYILPVYRGRLSTRLCAVVKQYWEAQGIRHFFAAAHIANRRSQAFIARGMQFHRVDICEQFSFYNGELTDVVFYTANRHDAELARECAQARAQRQWYLAA